MIMQTPTPYKSASLAHVARNSTRETRSEFDALDAMVTRARAVNRLQGDDAPDALDTIEFSFAIDWDYCGR